MPPLILSMNPKEKCTNHDGKFLQDIVEAIVRSNIHFILSSNFPYVDLGQRLYTAHDQAYPEGNKIKLGFGMSKISTYTHDNP